MKADFLPQNIRPEDIVFEEGYDKGHFVEHHDMEHA